MAFSDGRGTRFRDDEPVDQDDGLFEVDYSSMPIYDDTAYGDSYDDAYDDAYGAYDQDQAYADDAYDAGDGYAYSSVYDDYYESPYQSGGGVLSFIRDHWIPYLIAVVIAIALGAGAAVAVNIVGSTPDKEVSTESETETTPDESEIEAELDAATSDGSDVNGTAVSTE